MKKIRDEVGIDKGIDVNKSLYTHEYNMPIKHKDVQNGLRYDYMEESETQRQRDTEDFEIELHFKEQGQNVEDLILSILKETFIRNYLETEEKSL